LKEINVKNIISDESSAIQGVEKPRYKFDKEISNLINSNNLSIFDMIES